MPAYSGRELTESGFFSEEGEAETTRLTKSAGDSVFTPGTAVRHRATGKSYRVAVAGKNGKVLAEWSDANGSGLAIASAADFEAV